jgi:ribosome-associated protein
VAGALCYHDRHVKPHQPSKNKAKGPKRTRAVAGPRKPAGRPGDGRTKKKAARLRRGDGAAILASRRVDDLGRRQSLALAKSAIAAALDKKAMEPVLIDVTGRASYADFIAVVSGRSDRQVDAIAEGVSDALASSGRRPLGREGARNGRWVLLDFGDLVVHVFYHPLREVFDIESLWIDAPRVKLQIPAEARLDPAGGR